MLGPTLETPRLILRPPGPEDLDPLAAMLGDPEASRYIGGVQSRVGAWRNLVMLTGAWTINGFSMFSIIEKETGRWIGRAGPWEPVGWPAAEIGWGLDRSAWGKGYATEAAIRCTAFAFEELGWDWVVHVIDPANRPSVAVATRIGSRYLGPTKLPPPIPEGLRDLYGQTRAEWRARLP